MKKLYRDLGDGNDVNELIRLAKTFSERGPDWRAEGKDSQDIRLQLLEVESMIVKKFKETVDAGLPETADEILDEAKCTAADKKIQLIDNLLDKVG